MILTQTETGVAVSGSVTLIKSLQASLEISGFKVKAAANGQLDMAGGGPRTKVF